LRRFNSAKKFREFIGALLFRTDLLQLALVVDQHFE